MYSIQGLWSAAELGLPIVFIIVKNGVYGALTEFGALFGMPDLPGLKLPHIDFCALARSQAVTGRLVERCAELDDALIGAFRAPGPTLLEVAVTPGG
jgi:benzoylformate decarboxylase